MPATTKKEANSKKSNSKRKKKKRRRGAQGGNEEATYPGSTIHSDYHNTSACGFTIDLSTGNVISCCHPHNPDNLHYRCDFLSHLDAEIGLEGLKLQGRRAKDEYCNKAKSLTYVDSKNELESFEFLYTETQGDKWTNNTGRMTDVSQCEWHGIGCDPNGCVVVITLRNNNVTGTFPADVLWRLFKLKTLNLTQNNLPGNTTGTSPWYLFGSMDKTSYVYDYAKLFF